MPAVLVTGAGVRIGRAIAEGLADSGWSVAIHCHQSREDAEALTDRIVDLGGKACVVEADLAEIDDLPELIAAASDALGPIELLVNNAATFEADQLGSLERHAWQRQMDINLAAPVFLSKAFVAALPDDRPGNIVNIIDQRVWKPVPAYLSYQLSKSALWAATISLAQALAPRVRVNAIAPGPVLPSVRQSQADFDGQVLTLPLKRSPSLEEFSRAIRFLVETPSITGQMIALDGGQHIAWQTPDASRFPE